MMKMINNVGEIWGGGADGIWRDKDTALHART